jgi:hypothetical protein
MAYEQSIPAVINCKPHSLREHVRARSLAAVLALGAAVALSAVTSAVCPATAQELVWATSAGGDSQDSARAIAADLLGDSYVTGHFSGTATFGAGQANETVLEAGDSSDVFVAKYAHDGALLWATSAGGGNYVIAHAIATDRRGNSYITGHFGGTATFGAGEANETVLEAGASSHVFVAKYAHDGTLLWARSVGEGSSGVSLSLATDPRGNSYVTGEFSGTATFGAAEANETVLEAGDGVDVFVAKYARDGALLWATSAGGASYDSARAIATDPRSNSYVTGEFSGTATFGAGQANETVLEAEASSDVFVAMYDSEGALLWAASAGGASYDSASAIAADPRGGSYVTGEFSGTATFGAGEANETVLDAGDSSDVFVAMYDREGTLLWATSARGPSYDSARAIAADSRGGSYVTGEFSGTATFGAGEANETVLEAEDSSDVFMAMYDRDGTLRWARSAGAGSSGLGLGLATDPRGDSYYVTGEFSGTATFGAGEVNETVLEAEASSDVFVAKYHP